MAVSPYELGVYLGQEVDTDRATLLIQLATDLAETVVYPLPARADSVVLDVAARAYTNVSSARQLGLGSAQVSYGSNVGTGGMYLSRANIASLRRMAGSGGAFSIDPTPADAGTGLPAWDVNVTYLDEVPGLEAPR